MRIVFMGTPNFAADILHELKEKHEVVAVYTRADAVRGRGKTLVPSPVKVVAAEAGIPVFEPKSLRTEEEQERLRELAPDAICVAAYGKILPQEVLDIPPYGCLNVHASLLPKYRGAAPIERAILNGERELGVCIMKMEAGLDTGDYCISRSCEIGEESCEHLTGELSDKGACALLSALYAIEQGQDTWFKQDEDKATYAPKIEKGELNVVPSDSAVMNLRRVQASSTGHPSRCKIGGKGVTVLKALSVKDGDSVKEKVESLEEGRVAFVQKRLFLGCAEGAFEVIEVKPDGKKEMLAAAFASGIQGIKSGDIAWEQI